MSVIKFELQIYHFPLQKFFILYYAPDIFFIIFFVKVYYDDEEKELTNGNSNKNFNSNDKAIKIENIETNKEEKQFLNEREEEKQNKDSVGDTILEGNESV